MDALEQAGLNFHLALEELGDDELREVALTIEKAGGGAHAASLAALREVCKIEFAKRAHMTDAEPYFEFVGSHRELLAGRLFAEALASLTAEKSPAVSLLWRALAELLNVTATAFVACGQGDLPRGSVN